MRKIIFFLVIFLSVFSNVQSEEIKRITKKDGIITAQVGSRDKKPKQVNSWISTLESAFGNSKISEIYIPSFDCSWNFVSSVNK